MNWIEVTAEFAAAPEDWSLCIDLMREAGCPSVQETDSPPCLIGCVAESSEAQEQIEELGKQLTEAGAVAIRTRILADEDWSAVFRQYFKPMRVGKSFMVVPTWAEFEPAGNRLRDYPRPRPGVRYRRSSNHAHVPGAT